MLDHRTNRADVLAAFRRYQTLTGDKWAALYTSDNSDDAKHPPYGVVRAPGLSGPWRTAKEAYLAISQYCDRLESSVLTHYATCRVCGATFIGRENEAPICSVACNEADESPEDPPTYEESMIDSGRGFGGEHLSP